MKQTYIYTIGYEGVTPDALVQTLLQARVQILLDIRAVPLSRKPGFSKNKLAAHLKNSGIEYLGLKGLGTPAEGRAAARKKNKTGLETIYKAHLKTDDAKKDMAEAVRIAALMPACLLCFEHEPEFCHRLYVADVIAADNTQQIKHLNPVMAVPDKD